MLENKLTDKQKKYYEEREKLNILLPSIALDTIILAVNNNRLYVLLNDLESEFSLVGSFFRTGDTVEKNLERIIKEKVNLNLNISENNSKQIKTYMSPDRDDRGHIITTLYVVFISYVEDVKGQWFEVKFDDAVKLFKNEDLIIEANYDFVKGPLKFSDKEGHGYMLFDALNFLKNDIYKNGTLLKVFTNGFTFRDAWLFLENFENLNLTRTNVRRKLLSIVKETNEIKKENKSYAQIYKI